MPKWRMADDVCTGRAPLIAFLIAGNLRSFADPRAYKSLRHHLIDGLGGNGAVFMYGKRDREGWRDKQDLGRFSGSGERPFVTGTSNEELQAAEDYISSDGGPKVVSHYVSSTPDNISNPKCAWLQLQTSHKERDDWKYAFSALGQLHAVAMAFRMMLRHEEHHKMRFDSVVRLRPDGIWWQSAPPHCFLQPGYAYALDDHFWLTPREKAETVFDAYAEYTKCGNELPATHIDMGVAARCCGGGATMAGGGSGD